MYKIIINITFFFFVTARCNSNKLYRFIIDLFLFFLSQVVLRNLYTYLLIFMQYVYFYFNFDILKFRCVSRVTLKIIGNFVSCERDNLIHSNRMRGDSDVATLYSIMLHSGGKRQFCADMGERSTWKDLCTSCIEIFPYFV